MRMVLCLRIWVFIVLSFASLNGVAQCFSGILTVSGPGCGCLAGCNLSAFAGPNCGSGSTGNCSAGQTAMSISIPLEPTCEVTVEATMAVRPGCTASGGDAGDRLRVRNALGTAPWQTGTDNATLFSSHTQTGGDIVIEGSANRADEIITYEVNYLSGNCPLCILLPIELLEFNASLYDGVLSAEWVTLSETNNRGFYIEASHDGMQWSTLDFIAGQGTSSIAKRYERHIALANGLTTKWYVRLVQEDHDGARHMLPTVVVEDAMADKIRAFTGNGQVVLHNASPRELNVLLELHTIDGRLLIVERLVLAAGTQFTRQVNPGVYLLRYSVNGRAADTHKLAVAAW